MGLQFPHFNNFSDLIIYQWNTYVEFLFDYILIFVKNTKIWLAFGLQKHIYILAFAKQLYPLHVMGIKHIKTVSCTSLVGWHNELTCLSLRIEIMGSVMYWNIHDRECSNSITDTYISLFSSHRPSAYFIRIRSDLPLLPLSSKPTIVLSRFCYSLVNLIIACQRHVFVGAILSKQLWIRSKPWKPRTAMSPSTFIVGSFPKTWIIPEIQLVL